MPRILAVIGTDELRIALSRISRADWITTFCQDAESGLQLAADYPDALIVELDLSGSDGLTLLERLPAHKPPLILALTRLTTNDVMQALTSLNVDYVLRMPCRISTIILRLSDMLQFMDRPAVSTEEDPVLFHLHRLRIPAQRLGFRYLHIGINLYARDPGQRIITELYPQIGQLCRVSPGAVERDIRTAIQAGWRAGDRSEWESYFPGQTSCPTSKQFICAIARQL